MEKNATVLPVGSSSSRGNALHLRVKHLLGLLCSAQQDAVQLDPLHAGQRVALVAGTLHQNRDAELFQLLFTSGVW